MNTPFLHITVVDAPTAAAAAVVDASVAVAIVDAVVVAAAVGGAVVVVVVGWGVGGDPTPYMAGDPTSSGPKRGGFARLPPP